MAIRCFILLFLLTHLPLYALVDDDFVEARSRVTGLALKKFTKVMLSKGYNAAGIGEGIDHDTGKQNHLEVIFDVDELPNIEFARHLEVYAIQEFLKYINSEKGIQNYVAEYPYPVQFVSIVFISQHPEKGLFSVWNYKEELLYEKNDAEKPIGPLIEVHSETYQEAVNILAQENEFTGSREGSYLP